MRRPSLRGPWWIVRHVAPDALYLAPDSRVHVGHLAAVVAAKAVTPYRLEPGASARLVDISTEGES